eukprot:3313009-Prymnesium_polylepis.1
MVVEAAGRACPGRNGCRPPARTLREQGSPEWPMADGGEEEEEEWWRPGAVSGATRPCGASGT